MAKRNFQASRGRKLRTRTVMDVNVPRASKTSSLADYIEQINFPDYYFNVVSDYGLTHRPLQLRSDRINHILVFPGSFNPPHLAHLELLRYGLTKSGCDLNIVAAIILFLDDKSLVENFAAKKNSVLFIKAERVGLWKNHVLSDWYWTYNRSESEWDNFQNSLTEVITKDGFEVSWVALCGPDYVGVDGLPPGSVWGCKEIIVSDIGRPADFIRRASETLISIRDYKAWEKLGPSLEIIQEHAKESTSQIVSETITRHTFDQHLLDEKPNCNERMVGDLSKETFDESNSIAVCRHRDFPEWTIRFVPANGATMKNVSSTRVRGIIQSNVRQEQLLKDLEELVLSPETLIEMLAEKPWEERVPSPPTTRYI